jgi:putative membrane protein
LQPAGTGAQYSFYSSQPRLVLGTAIFSAQLLNQMRYKKPSIMKKIFVLLAAASFAIACNNDAKTDSVENAEKQNDKKDSGVTVLGIDTDSTSGDKDFMVKAASGGLLEVELGKLAQTNGSSAAVKDFGKMMVMDHTKANTELVTLAKAKNITVPSVPGEDAQKHIDELKAKNGAEFDKAYVDLMVDDHKEDIDEFGKAADDAKDADIKALAAKTLPTLKEHLTKIQAIKDGMK